MTEYKSDEKNNNNNGKVSLIVVTSPIHCILKIILLKNH